MRNQWGRIKILILTALLVVLALLATPHVFFHPQSLFVALVETIFVFGAAALTLGFATLATWSLKGLHDHSGQPWESIDILWVISFFVLHIAAPMAWFVFGRSIREHELTVRASRQRSDSIVQA